MIFIAPSLPFQDDQAVDAHAARARQITNDLLAIICGLFVLCEIVCGLFADYLSDYYMRIYVELFVGYSRLFVELFSGYMQVFFC